MSHLTSHHSLPPFAEDVKTAPLVSVSLAKLEANDNDASDAFFKACKDLGFFYLDMVGSKLGEIIVTEAEELDKVQKEFFKLPNEVKDVYGRPHLHPFYAYRYSEASVKDENGVPLRNQNYNVRLLGLSGCSFHFPHAADRRVAPQRRHSRPVRAPGLPLPDPREPRAVRAIRGSLQGRCRLPAGASQHSPWASQGDTGEFAPHPRTLWRPRPIHSERATALG